MQLGVDDVDAHGRGDAAHRHTRAGEQCLQQHVAGTSIASVPAGRRMQTGADRDRPRLDQSGDTFGLKGRCGFKRRARAEWIVAVVLLEWCLQFPKRGCVQAATVAPNRRAGYALPRVTCVVWALPEASR